MRPASATAHALVAELELSSARTLLMRVVNTNAFHAARATTGHRLPNRANALLVPAGDGAFDMDADGNAGRTPSSSRAARTAGVARYSKSASWGSGGRIRGQPVQGIESMKTQLRRWIVVGPM